MYLMAILIKLVSGLFSFSLNSLLELTPALYRFKAFVAIGDYNGHVGLGVKCSKEV
jgi:hypothetical protein